LDPATRTLLVEIDMPNKERQLQPGTYVSATLYLKQHPNALVIPPAAIVTGANKERAVFKAEQGKARHIAIKTDLDDGKWVEVVDGLSGDEDVIVVGKSGLKDGQAVDPSPYNLPAGTPSSQKY
jgi:multidrug efflux pump subunit AcrA (membrane-fusion protein)